MFIIWGFSHKTVKSFGCIQAMACARCHNNTKREVMKVTSWFTIFFIPVIPYKRQYFLMCPVCNAAYDLKKEDFDMLTAHEAIPSQTYTYLSAPRNQMPVDKYAGKTPTQIEYLKQIEEFERQKSGGDTNQ